MQQSLIFEITKENTESFLAHIKATFKSYFSNFHHNWVESLAIQSHTEDLILLSLPQQAFLNNINNNRQKFEYIFYREYESFFNTKRN